MRVSHGDLLLHVKKRRVKGAVVHGVVRDLLGGGVLVVRRNRKVLQIQLIFALAVGVARRVKRDVRQLFRLERDGEHGVYLPARTRNSDHDILLGIEDALVNGGHLVIRDLHRVVGIRPAGRIVILRDVLRVVAQFNLHAGKVQLGLALDVGLPVGRGNRDALRGQLDDGDVVGVLSYLTKMDTGRIPAFFTNSIQGRIPSGKTRNQTVIVDSSKAVLLVPAVDLLVLRGPRSASVIRRQTPIVFIDFRICRRKADRIAAREILDDIIAARNVRACQSVNFAAAANIERNGTGNAANCRGDGDGFAVIHCPAAGILAVYGAVLNGGDACIGGRPDDGVQKTCVIVCRHNGTYIDIAGMTLLQRAFSLESNQHIGKAAAQGQGKVRNRVAGVNRHAFFQDRLAVRRPAVQGDDAAALGREHAVGRQRRDARVGGYVGGCPDNLQSRGVG